MTATIASEEEYYRYLENRYYENEYYHDQGIALLAITPYGRKETLSISLTENTLNWKKAFNEIRSLSSIDKNNDTLSDAVNLHISMKVLLRWFFEVLGKIVPSARNASLLISGSSGSGKTEFAKIAIRIIELLQIATFGDSVGLAIMDYYSYISEMFGNAPTSLNQNSSRYGRVLDIQFNRITHKLEYCSCTPYLIERSRISRKCIISDSTYHVLKEVTKNGKLPQEMIHHMKKCNIDNIKVENIIKEVLAILRISDNILDMKMLHELYTTIDIELKNYPQLRKRTYLALRIPIERPQKNREIDLKSELQQWSSAMSTFAQSLYIQTFQWLLRLDEPDNPLMREHLDLKKDRSNDTYSIRIIDFFGFESFEINELFQLLVNYTNEELNYINLEECVVMESELLFKEGLLVEPLQLNAKYTVKKYINGEKKSVLSIINEESQYPNRDIEYLCRHMLLELKGKVTRIHINNKRPTILNIDHYAQTVSYDMTNMIKDNVLSGRNEIDVLVSNSIGASDQLTGSNSSKLKKYVIVEFVQELNSLLRSISRDSKYYIKCVQPNRKSQKMTIHRDTFDQQLEAVGAFNIYRIRRHYSAVRYSYEEFCQKYYVLLDKFSIDHMDREGVGILMNNLAIDSSEFQYGNTRMFYSHTVQQLLDQLQHQLLTENAILIQRNFQAYIQKKKYRLLKRAVLAIQSIYRYRKYLKTELLRKKNMVNGKLDTNSPTIINKETDRTVARIETDTQHSNSNDNHVEIPMTKVLEKTSDKTVSSDNSSLVLRSIVLKDDDSISIGTSEPDDNDSDYEKEAMLEIPLDMVDSSIDMTYVNRELTQSQKSTIRKYIYCKHTYGIDYVALKTFKEMKMRMKSILTTTRS